jgi:hypothetical protein
VKQRGKQFLKHPTKNAWLSCFKTFLPKTKTGEKSNWLCNEQQFPKICPK